MTKTICPSDVTTVPKLLLLHGAGAGLDSPFLQAVMQQCTALGYSIEGFEFSYMQEMRRTGKRRPPPKVEKLLQELKEYLAAETAPVVVIGKSMGGRIATMLAADRLCQPCLSGVVALGYPFHPTGKPEKLRVAHLPDVRVPLLIVQGSRDPFGHREEVPAYPVGDKLALHWLEGGNHDFDIAKNSGRSQQDLIAEAVDRLHQWITAGF
ncbi:alpha/beta family hydrolase [Oceanobacter mangrovi]|uniref:alpha/beta family hydrolase n=1 Tax=Oceanobacter mangrovi TaxID=2862510 RepID=UPI001C8DBF3E|nr:alpha/beta family hydrolase [Oceanobacter mangrovi]